MSMSECVTLRLHYPPGAGAAWLQSLLLTGCPESIHDKVKCISGDMPACWLNYSYRKLHDVIVDT
jgi:hypothetical protein